MNVVLGASGQVGAALVAQLRSAGQPVTGVVRDEKKADELRKMGAQVVVADALDVHSLRDAFQGGTTALVLTPESGHSEDVIGETKTILANYRAALADSPIRKIVGLSSLGAQYKTNSGNLEMSALLEAAFEGLSAQQIFVRPAYFYSNWLLLVEEAKKSGVLHTFYPVELAIPMTSPLDIAAFIAKTMSKDVAGSPIYEVEGPEWYSSHDVAQALSEVLKRPIAARQTPREQWPATLQQMGFTPDATENFIKMTELVADGKARPSGHGTLPVKTTTTLREYFAEHVRA